jgi:hypothetical protein
VRVLPALLLAAVTVRYPVKLAIEASPEAANARYVHEAAGVYSAPPAAPSLTPAGAQALEAYSAIAARLFDRNSAVSLVLRIDSIETSVVPELDGWHAVVVHHLSMAVPAVQWTATGRGRIDGLGEGAVPEGFARAAQMAAQNFEAHFEDSPKMRGWLSAQGIEPGSIARRGPGVELSAPSQVRARTSPRAALVAYLDAGPGLDLFTTGASDGASSSEVVPGLDLRAGIAAEYVFAQLGFAWRSQSDSRASHEYVGFGLDLGPCIGIGSMVELALGAGLHAMIVTTTLDSFGPNPVSSRDLHWVGSGLAALRITPPLGKFRLRMSVEARLRFSSLDSTVVDSPGLQASEKLEADKSFVLLIGGEIPLVGGGR